MGNISERNIKEHSRMVSCFLTIFSIVAIEINDIRFSNGEALGEVQLPHMFEGFCEVN